MLTKEFINTVFVNEIEKMTVDASGNATHPYVGFSLICQSIEVLGACFDEYDWEDRDLSGLRFRLAISKLFPKNYQLFNTKKGKIDLYKNLRCPMVHQMRPGKYIKLSERKHELSASVSNRHLTMQGDQLILIYEDFLSDFKEAGIKIIGMIENGGIKSKKVVEHNISTPSDKKFF